MDKKQFTGKNALLYVLQKLKEKLSTKVDKEHKTGSESEYKVLSDNNLTDELVQKIQDAGSSTFNGEYNSLDGIPTLDGKEIKGTLTSEELGLAKSSDIPTDYVSDEELEQKGYQTSSDVESTITKKGYQTASDVESTLSEKNYATESFVTDKGFQNASQVQSAITSALSKINKKEVVTSTEEMTDENTIYLMSNEQSEENNIYDEYIVANGKPEKIGTTKTDLTRFNFQYEFCETL